MRTYRKAKQGPLEWLGQVTQILTTARAEHLIEDIPKFERIEAIWVSKEIHAATTGPLEEAPSRVKHVDLFTTQETGSVGEVIDGVETKAILSYLLAIFRVQGADLLYTSNILRCEHRIVEYKQGRC